MKKTILIFLVAMLTIPSVAANVLILIPKSGQPTSFELRNSPTITFSDSKVIVECGQQQLSYERSDVSSFQFKDELPTSISFANNVATENITVITPDGRMVLSQPSSSVLNLQQLGSGVFIVHQGINTFKVINK